MLSVRVGRGKTSMCAGRRCKGMYGPLASLLPRLGALRLLELQPSLIGETVAAMEDQAACGPAAAMIMTLLRQLRSKAPGAHSATKWAGAVHAELVEHRTHQCRMSDCC